MSSSHEGACERRYTDTWAWYRTSKIDIKSAYRIVPVHPEDRPLLGMRWQGKIYVDATLPFGLRSAPKIFNALADAAQLASFPGPTRPRGRAWERGYSTMDYSRMGARYLWHYLDNLSLLELHVRESAGLIVKLCVVHVKFLESHWHLRNVKDQHAVWFFWASSSTP